MAKMKWNLNGKGVAPKSREEGMLGYDGPDLPKGSWPAKIKRMTVHEIQSKANLGKPRISVLLEVQTGGMEDKAKYHGAPVWDNLNIIDSSVPFVNGFLHALTNGSESAKRAIESAFWDDDKGPDFRKTTNKRGDDETHIIKIGKIKIDSPQGEFMVQITTRPGTDQKGNYRPEVTGYLPFQGANPAAVEEDLDEDEDEDEDDDDLLDDDEFEEEEEDDEEDEDDDDEDEPVAAGTSRRTKPF